MDLNQLGRTPDRNYGFVQRLFCLKVNFTKLSFFVACVLFFFSSTAAFAGEKDITTGSFIYHNGRPGFEVTDCKTEKGKVCGAFSEADIKDAKDHFKRFAKDLAVIIAPPLARPASSIGSAKMNVLVDFSAAFLFEKAETTDSQTGKRIEGGRVEAWKRAFLSGEKDLTEEPFYVVHVMAHKGLPHGFGLGAYVSHLVDSNIFAIGGELKWSFLEGYRYVPDVAVRVIGGATLGVDNLTHVYAAVDGTISKTFGIGGALALTPTLGYQFTMAISGLSPARYYPAGPLTPWSSNTSTDAFNSVFGFATDVYYTHRIALGFDVDVSIFKLGLDFTYATENIFQVSALAGIEF